MCVLFLFCVISLNRTLKTVLNNCDKMRTDRFSLKVSLLKVYVCACICKKARRGYQMSCSWSSGSWKSLLWLREMELRSPWRAHSAPLDHLSLYLHHQSLRRNKAQLHMRRLLSIHVYAVLSYATSTGGGFRVRTKDQTRTAKHGING